MRFAALAMLLGLSCTAQAGEPDTYIFDALALQPYKGNFARLVKGEAVPAWVKAIAVQGAGTAGPSRTVDVGGTPYRLDHVCKVDACATNTIDVLWAPRGAKVWAALVEGGRSPVLLGGPKDGPLKALEQATGSAVPGAPPAPAAPAPVVATTAQAPVPASPPMPAELAAPAAPPSVAPEPDSYIFDVLALQPYKGNFARLVKGKTTPDWVKAISVQGAGTAGPSRTVDVGGTPYRLDRVCEGRRLRGQHAGRAVEPARRQGLGRAGRGRQGADPARRPESPAGQGADRGGGCGWSRDGLRPGAARAGSRSSIRSGCRRANPAEIGLGPIPPPRPPPPPRWSGAGPARRLPRPARPGWRRPSRPSGSASRAGASRRRAPPPPYVRRRA